jgi:CTD nuclear envelope phosphatase 1
LYFAIAYLRRKYQYVKSKIIDNAIPIEGWINDPTDNDLLHLVPLLEGLQYVTDVRALLALRGGEDGKHMVV